MFDVSSALAHVPWFPVLALAFSAGIALLTAVVVRAFVRVELAKATRCCSTGTRMSPLVSYAEAHHFLRGNPHIRSGYRHNFSLRETLQSLFSVHNETANVWSHFVGFLAFLYFTARSMIDLLVAEAHADLAHQVTLVIYCTGAMSLLAASTTFHWFGCLSEEVYTLTAKLDYTGIAIMILVSFFPFMYSMFYCRMAWGVFYSVVISVLTVGAIFVSWSDTFNKPGYQWLRAGLFIGVGLFGGIPLPHACFSLGLDKSWDIFWPLLLMGALYIGGALCYAMHIPERFFPGHLDYFGHSHLLFHICVVAAAAVHLWNVHRLLEWRAVAMPTC